MLWVYKYDKKKKEPDFAVCFMFVDARYVFLRLRVFSIHCEAHSWYSKMFKYISFKTMSFMNGEFEVNLWV